MAETRFSLGFPQSPNQPEDYRKTLWPDFVGIKVIRGFSTTEMGKNFPQTNILIPRDGSQLPSYVWLIVSKPVEAGQQDNVFVATNPTARDWNTGCALTMDGHGYGAAPMAKKLRKTSIATAEKKIDGAASERETELNALVEDARREHNAAVRQPIYLATGFDDAASPLLMSRSLPCVENLTSSPRGLGRRNC